MTHRTYYDLLHVAATARDDEIRAAYRRLAKFHHPDTNPLDRNLAAARFRLIQDAYEHLRDPYRRREYDQFLQNQAWYPHTASNGNAQETHASDVFSAARRSLERLMRLMANTRDMRVNGDRDHV